MGRVFTHDGMEIGADPEQGQQIHLAALRHKFRSGVEAIVEELHLDRSIDAKTRRPEAPRTWARALPPCPLTWAPPRW